MAREKRKCKQLYPDWRDDEYNCLHNRFVWAYTVDPNPSFTTFNVAEIYYNRQTKLYYFSYDIDYFSNPSILKAVLKAVIEDYPQSNYELYVPMVVDIINFGLQASTFEELITKIKFLLTGIENYNG